MTMSIALPHDQATRPELILIPTTRTLISWLHEPHVRGVPLTFHGLYKIDQLGQLGCHGQVQCFSMCALCWDPWIRCQKGTWPFRERDSTPTLQINKYYALHGACRVVVVHRPWPHTLLAHMHVLPFKMFRVRRRPATRKLATAKRRGLGMPRTSTVPRTRRQIWTFC